MKKNVFIYAGAALAVAACGVLLSKDLREFLFDSLSGHAKRLPEGIDTTNDHPELSVENIPGPTVDVAIENGCMAFYWKTRMTPLEFVKLLGDDGIDTSEAVLGVRGRQPVPAKQYTLGREPSFASVHTTHDEFVIHTTASVSDGLPYSVGYLSDQPTLPAVRNLYQKTSGYPLSPGAANRLEELIRANTRQF